jgi:hypothetical protein
MSKGFMWDQPRRAEYWHRRYHCGQYSLAGDVALIGMSASHYGGLEYNRLRHKEGRKLTAVLHREGDATSLFALLNHISEVSGSCLVFNRKEGIDVKQFTRNTESTGKYDASHNMPHLV